MRLFLVTLLAKFLQRLVRGLGISSGSALPGLVIEKIYPNVLKAFSQQLDRRIILITGTNGKTTTTKLIAKMLEASGAYTISNNTGSNFSRGVISSLVEHSNWKGRLPAGAWAVLEVDEAYAGGVASAMEPRVAVILNIFRDQLDRFGELDTTLYLIGRAVEHITDKVILNGADPMVLKLKDYCKDDAEITVFGVSEELSKSFVTDDELHKKNKQSRLHQKSDVTLQGITHKSSYQELTIKSTSLNLSTEIKLLGAHNALNTTAAVAAVSELFADQSIRQRMFSVLPGLLPPFGRGETIILDEGKKVELVLVKNPAGMNQIINSHLSSHSYQTLLFALNDNYADGRDVSWIWDAGFEQIKVKDTDIICTGSRSNDMALRFKYREVEDFEVIEDTQVAVASLIGGLEPGHTAGIVATYTAMMKIRRILEESAKLEKIHDQR